MRVHLQLRVRNQHPGEYRSGNRILSLAYSLALHAGVVTLLMAVPRGSADRPLFNSVIVPLETQHKIVYYSLRKRLPEVSPANPTAAETKPDRTQQPSDQTIVTAPKAREGKQFVYIPAPKIEIQQEIRAPNVIAFQPSVIQPPEKPKTKTFQPPPAETPRPVAPAALPAAPAVAVKTEDKSVLKELLKPAAAPRRQFVMAASKSNPETPAPAPIPVPPAETVGAEPNPVNPLSDLIKPAAPHKQFVMPRSSGGATATASTTTVAAPPTIGSVTDQAENNSLNELIKTAAPRRQFVAPTASPGGGNKTTAALPAPPAVPESGRAGNTTLAIISLTPANTPEIPRLEGARQERVTAGPPNSSNTRAEMGNGNSPVTIPDVAIHGNAPNPADSASITTRGPSRITPKEPGVAVPQLPAPVAPFESPHVSVPQWPSNRSLPVPIEQHFRNRVVYMTVLPAKPGEADWILWFGEEGETLPGTRLLMRPPTLQQQSALPLVPAHDEHGNGKLRVAGVIRKNGHLESCTGVNGSAVNGELATALESWRFSPATRNGTAVDVNAVLEIPVSFTSAASH
jgi:hypothetical protein